MRLRIGRTSLHKLLVLATAFGATAIPAPTQENQSPESQLKQLSLEQLGNIEVTTVSKTPQEVWKTAAAIYVITQEDIRRSGATSIPEALRLAPGVEVAQISGDKWAIGIRGFGGRLNRDVLVMIDGRSVYTTLIAGTYWEVQNTVMEDIDRIEVIRGPGGTVWGPNAVNGVINIITKNSKDTQGTLTAVGGGNVEQGFVTERYGGTVSPGLTYRFYGMAFNRGPEYHTDGNEYDHWATVQGGFRTDWVKNQRDSFTLQGDAYDERAGETVDSVTYAPPYSQTVTGNMLLSGGNILGRWNRNYNDTDGLQLQVYYDRTNRHEPNFADIRNTVDIDFIQRFHAGSSHHFSWGLGARASHGYEPEIVSGLHFIPNDRTDQLYTGFIQDNITLVPDRLIFEAGTKLLKTNYTGVELEPSGRLLWTVTPTQTAWLAVTHAVRTPSDGERDFYLSGYIGTAPNGLPYFARFNANPNFQSEKLNGYEIGYRRLAGRNLFVDIATFYNQYYDLFSEDIIGPPFIEDNPAPPHVLLPAEFGNGLQGSTMGGEIAPEWKVTSFWRLHGSYSFLHMVLGKSPGSLDVGTAPSIEGSSPQNQVLLQSSFDLPKRVTFDFDFRYISRLRALDIPSYSTGNARLAWNFHPHWEVSVVGENLFQPYHYEFASDPGPNVGIKRSAYGKSLWTSKEN